jgi:hypothetical protein
MDANHQGKKIAVVTASFGGIDAPKSFPKQSVPCERIFFDDKNSPYPLAPFDGRMKAKFFKLQTHKILWADYVIWLDGSVEIKRTDFVEKMVAALDLCDIVIPCHPSRACIYQEARFITDSIAAGSKYLAARYSPAVIAREADYYAAQDHPANAGLWWCGLFARPFDERMNSFFDAWWDEVLKWSCFDQNSFAFLARKYALKINTLELGDFHNNATCNVHRHLKIQ